MVDGGYDCIDRDAISDTEYLYHLNSDITKSGIIKSWCTYMNVAGTIALRIYRSSGDQYLYIGGASAYCSVGYQSHTANITVKSGDIVGILISSGEIDGTSGGHQKYRWNTSGVDVTTDTLKTDWDSGYGIDIISLGITVNNDYYVKTDGDDAKDGFTWANAWKTINKAATTALDGMIIHIGFGDYTNEPSANKIAPQNIGASGITYLPETATTGGGTGTVSIEQNT